MDKDTEILPRHAAAKTQILRMPLSEEPFTRQQAELERLGEQYDYLQKLAESLSRAVDRVEKVLLKFEGAHTLFSDRLSRLERIVYGGCGIALTAILTALVYLVVKK